MEQQLQQEAQLEDTKPPLICQFCRLTFDTSKSLDVHLHYHKENLDSKWGVASGSEDNNNEKTMATSGPPIMEAPMEYQFFEYADNSTFQRIQEQQHHQLQQQQQQQQPPPLLQHTQRLPSFQRYQPYSYERLTSPQVQCDKCGFICDYNALAEHDATAHPPFSFFLEYPEEESRRVYLNLDSKKITSDQEDEDEKKGEIKKPEEIKVDDIKLQEIKLEDMKLEDKKGDENISNWYKEENGNPFERTRESPDFASVTTSSMSSPNSVVEMPGFYEQQPPQMMQLAPPQLGSSQISSQQLAPAQLPSFASLPPQKGGGTWKSNEARRPKTYNCTACNKWFTSSGHLKRHYNTTLHRNAVKASGNVDPANMPVSSHHHPTPQLQQQPQQQEETYHFHPEQPIQIQQQEQQIQEEYQEYFQYPNGLPPHTTDFSTEPLPSFSQFTTTISGYSCVGGLMTVLPELELLPQEVSSTTEQQPIIHKCFDCDKTFNKACYLTQHNKSFHAGDKPYKCQRCGKRFTQEFLHQEHLSKHAGEKPYKCEMCPKQFNHKTDLRRHMCLHSGDKPYACDFCGKGFIRKDHMLKHAETHKKKALASSYKKMELDPRLHLRVM